MSNQVKRGRIKAQMSRDMHKGLPDTAARRKQRLALGKSAAKDLVEGTIKKNVAIRDGSAEGHRLTGKNR